MILDVCSLSSTINKNYLLIITSLLLIGLLLIIKYPLKKVPLSFFTKKKVGEFDIPGGYNDNAIILYSSHPKTIFFSYVNAKGSCREREAKIETIFKRKGIIYLHGHCNLANNTRTFRIDRITDRVVIDRATGETGPVSKIFNI